MNRRRLVTGIVLVFVLLAGGTVAWRVFGGRGGGTPVDPALAGVDLDSVAAVSKAARTYIGNQELGRAEAVLRRALEDGPDDALLRELLGDVLLQREDEVAAMAQYAAIADRTDASAEALFKAGSLAEGMGDHERAIGYLARASTADPGNSETAVLLANAQLELGRLDEAKATLARAAVLDEGRATVWGMLAEIAVRENSLEIGAQHIAKGRRIEPSSIPWRVLEARIMRRRGEPEKAVLLLDGVRGDERFEASVVAEMAAALGMLGRGDDALAIYRVAVRERPADAEIRYQAALWAERQGELGEALEQAQAAAMMGDERARAVVERLKDE